MRDHGALWTAPPDRDSARIETGGLRAAPVPDLPLTLVSGALDAARAALAPDAAEAGLWGVATGAPYVVRIARDRALIVGGIGARVPGWREAGWALSAFDDGHLVLDLEGEDLADVAAEATAADLEAGSPSAATLFAGVPALLYRIAEGRARLHVETSLGPYVWRWLETRAPSR